LPVKICSDEVYAGQFLVRDDDTPGIKRKI
jgi:hypothetical protein